MQHAKKNIYGVSVNSTRVASYAVTSPSTIELTRTVPFTGRCEGKTSVFVIAEDSAPYRVFSAQWPSPNACGTSLSVDANGVVDKVTDSWNYASGSGIHGRAVAKRNGRQYIYSADLNGDIVWTHVVDDATGRVTEVGRLKMSQSGLHPRHLEVHPNGTYVYVLMEAANAISAFSLDTSTFAAANQSSTYSLIPQGASLEHAKVRFLVVLGSYY